MTDETEPKSAPEAKGQPKPPMGKWIGIGIGAGIGSAALAAALLYTSGARKKSERK